MIYLLRFNTDYDFTISFSFIHHSASPLALLNKKSRPFIFMTPSFK